MAGRLHLWIAGRELGMVTQEMPQEPVPMGLYQVLMFPGPTLLSLPGTEIHRLL